MTSILECHDPRQFLLTANFIGGFALLFFILVSTSWQRRELWLGKLGLLTAAFLILTYTLFLTPWGVHEYPILVGWLRSRDLIQTELPRDLNTEELTLLFPPENGSPPPRAFVYFGYTYCPDVCPTTLSHLQDYYKLVGDKSAPPVIFVTLDRDRDSEARLKEYLQYFVEDPHYRRLPDSDLDRLIRPFAVRYHRNNETNREHYSVDHSAQLFLLNSQGKILQSFPHDIDARQLRQRIDGEVSTVVTKSPWPQPSDPTTSQPSNPSSMGRSTQTTKDQPQSENKARSGLRVHAPWVRAIPGRLSTGAFMEIENTSAQDLSLIGAESPVADQVQLHTHDRSQGVMKMRQVESIPVPGHGGRAVLEPGAYHIMLIQLRQDLKVGDQVDLLLRFSNGENLQLKVPVLKRPPEEK